MARDSLTLPMGAGIGPLVLEVDTDHVFLPTILGRMFLRELRSEPLAGKRVLDLGVGSGMLGIAAVLLGAEVVALDINPRAIDTAGANAKRNGVELDLRVSDGLAALSDDEQFDLIVANTPGVPRSMTSPQNFPPGGDDRDTLFDEAVMRGRDFLRPYGCLITYGFDLLNLSALEDFLRAHWEAVEIRSDSYFSIRPPRAAAPIGNDDREALLKTGQIITAGGRDFTRTRLYRCWRGA